MDGFLEIVPAQAIASPCVNICRIDPASSLCEGCARTIDEIAGWTTMNPAQRAAILSALPGRRGPASTAVR